MTDKVRYYVTCLKSGFYDTCQEWALPTDDEVGEWRKSGESPYSFLAIKTMQGLIRYGLEDRIFRAEHRGFTIQLPEYVLKEDILAVREACLLYELEEWGLKEALTFACDSIERCLEAAEKRYKLAKPETALWRGVEICRQYVKIIETITNIHNEPIPRNDISSNLANALRKDAKYSDELDANNIDIPSEDEITHITNQVREIADTGAPPSSYMAKGIDPCLGYLMYAYAASQASRYARDAMGWMALPPGFFTPENRELADKSLKVAWQNELDWQTNHLSSLLGEDKLED